MSQPVNPQKSKLMAALLGIFVGAFGVHRFVWDTIPSPWCN